MKMKRVMALLLMQSMLMGLLGFPSYAEYTFDHGIYTWDFAEYTQEVKTTEGGFIEEYNGLAIAIANNGADSDHDKVTNGGVYWRGGASEGESTRYIAYTPTENGTLSVTGQMNSSGGRWGISTSLNVASFSAEHSASSTSVAVVKMDCVAGTTYYIFNKARKASINRVEYITEHASLTAAVTLNNMYGDNMLLQRDKPVYIDGFSENADNAEVILQNDNDSNDVQRRSINGFGSGGEWSVYFDAVANYTDTYTLTVIPSSKNPKTMIRNTVVSNIKFGDLYLCGGQSNMWYYATYYIGLDYTQEEIDACADSDIRILQLPTPSEDDREINRSQPQEKLSIDAEWRELDSEFVMKNYLPAAVYSIATKLHNETDVPIGILSTAVGGTTIAQWLENTGIDDFNKKKNWYNTRIYPLRNMELSGIFWYQGCSDKDNGAEYYEKKMTTLIHNYRYLFSDNSLPFYYVQLARNGIVYPDTTNNEREDNTGMRDVRQAQTDTYLNMEDKTNLGFVSTLDIYGEKEYIAGKNKNFSARVNYHTGQKPVIAQRLVDLALKDIYNRDTRKDGSMVYSHGPRYQSHRTNGNKLIVEFDCNGSLSVMPTEQYADNHSPEVWAEKGIDTTKVQEFEIAGEDGVYHPASAVIENNKVVLTSEEVTNPVSVRYCYSAYPECPNLTDESGLPAYAFTSGQPQSNTWNFGFGNTSRDGFIQVNSSDEYDADKGYGFLGISEKSADYTKVVDGYFQNKESLTTLITGDSYVKSNDKQRPVRFAVKVEPNTYYKVKVTMSADNVDADVTLTSERRHFILTNEKIRAGSTLTKEFTVAVHDVKWKNRDSGKPVPTVYTDDMLNIGILGKNAALNSIEIQQIKKPKTLWIFGDSTVCDTYTAIPYNGFDTASGWGQSAAKYINETIAVVNLAEGGLATSETSYFDMGKDDIGDGDIVLMQMGHNENSVSKYKANLDYYHDAVSKAGATFILCSPIQRLTLGQTELPWKSDDVDTVYTPAAKEYAQSKGIPYIDLNKLTTDCNTQLGVVRAWYLHTAYWQAGVSEATEFNDPTHMNDYGSDVTCRILMEKLREINSAEGYVQDIFADAMTPSEEIMKNGTDNYVMPPYKGNDEIFPYPGGSGFEHEIDFSTEVLNNSVLSKITVKRNVTLSYITVFAISYDKYGVLSDIVMKRLEPSGAGTSEEVLFTDDTHPLGMNIPQGGYAKVFVWNGAFIDGSMTMKPLSECLKIQPDVI